MKTFLLPAFVLLCFCAKILFSQQNGEKISGAKPGIIINGILCKIGNQQFSCVPKTCDSVEICQGDSVSFCTDTEVDLTTDTAYWIQWNFTGSSNYPVSLSDSTPSATPICYYPKWTLAGSYTVDIFYNGWLTSYPWSDCYAQGPSHWIIKINVCSLGAAAETGSENTVKIFPNPSADMMYVELLLAEKTILEVYSVVGEKMKSYELKKKNNTVNISEIQSGIYFCKFFVNNRTVLQRKIIIIK